MSDSMRAGNGMDMRFTKVDGPLAVGQFLSWRGATCTHRQRESLAEDGRARSWDLPLRPNGAFIDGACGKALPIMRCVDGGGEVRSTW